VLSIKYPVINVGSDLPPISWVCLPKVDDKEGYLVVEPFVDTLQAARLSSEGGSGVAPKDKGHGPVPFELGQAHPFFYST